MPFTGVMDIPGMEMWAVHVLFMKRRPRASINIFTTFVDVFVTARIDKGMAQNQRLFIEIYETPEKRKDPYRVLRDAPLFRKSIRNTLMRDVIGTMAIGAIGLAVDKFQFGEAVTKYISERICTGQLRADSLLMASALAIAVSAHFIKDRLIKKTWQDQVMQTYAVIEQHGVDGYLAMLTQHWRTMTIGRYVHRLEKKGILGENEFTPKGEEWYRQQIYPGLNEFLGRVKESQDTCAKTSPA